MTRVLITSDPITGHIRPGLEIARSLVDDGHEVIWYTGRTFESLVADTGARFVPLADRLDHGDALQAALAGGPKPGIREFKKVIREVFIDPIPEYIADLTSLVDEFQPDVIVGNHTFMSGLLLAEQRDLPSVAFSTSPLSLSSVDVAPWGTGLPPASSRFARLGFRVLTWAIRNMVFRREQRIAERIRADLGLPALDGFFLDWPGLIADRYLMSTIPELEYPRSDLPPVVQFVGFTVPAGVDNWTPPDWWPDIAAAREAGRPVVFVTQGTAATDPTDLVLPTIEALRSRDVLVVATTGGRDPEQTLPAADRPDNARLDPFIPFDMMLPLADVMITNGGFGGVQTALASGVPLVVAGDTEDKPEVNARVAWSGAGISLRTGRPRPEKIASAVDLVLGDSAYRARAQHLMKSYARHPGAAGAAAAIVEVAGSQGESHDHR
jgi:UDP:flavonoid glycosyltransferase YjiC (YdhE family)